jgi:Ca2+-binding RTX toxin-like protein
MSTWRGNNRSNNYDFQDHNGGGNDTGWGGGGHDKIWGWHGHDKLYGENGNDYCYGENGHDWLYGETGHDWVYGGNGNDHSYGGNGNDHVYGGKGHDWVYGNKGNDWVYGDEGHDRCYGGDGHDRFYFHWKDTGTSHDKTDTIYDFDHDDKIYLKGEYEHHENDYGGEGEEPEPGNGEYTIWQKDNHDWVIKYNAHDNHEEYHYIVCKGENPTGYIEWY